MRILEAVRNMIMMESVVIKIEGEEFTRKMVQCIHRLKFFMKHARKTILFRSSHQRCSLENVLLINFAKFAGKQLCQSLFFNKVGGLMPATLLKKRPWHRCFAVKFAKLLRTPFFIEPRVGLPLIVIKGERTKFSKT